MTPLPCSPQPEPRKFQNGIELFWNGLNWVPVVNPANYPKLFNKDGTRIAPSSPPPRA